MKIHKIAYWSKLILFAVGLLLLRLLQLLLFLPLTLLWLVIYALAALVELIGHSLGNNRLVEASDIMTTTATTTYLTLLPILTDE